MKLTEETQDQAVYVCPKCMNDKVYTIESRKTKEGFVRRRRECTECSTRITTYEISDAFMQEVRFAMGLLRNVESYVNRSKQTSKCFMCKFNTNNKCSFEFPEYNTQAAADCSFYSTSI